MDLSFCKRLPKLELHAHLNGAITLEGLKELYDIQQQKEPKKHKDWDGSEFVKESYSLESFFSLFKKTYKLTATPETVVIAVERVIEDFAKDNVVYLELRSTLRKTDSMTKRQYLEAMRTGVLNCKEKFPSISVKIIVSVNRNDSLEGADENVKVAIEYHDLYPDLIVGVDVSGHPESNKFSDYMKMLDLAKAKKLKVTVHCAEVVGKQEIQDILDYNPDRIGHGTCIHKSHGGDLKLWKLLLEKKIPVELCLTSNIKCRTVFSYADHHFKLLHAEKHPITISTDDKGAFNTTLSKEFEIVQKTFGLSEEELWQLSFNSIDYIFASESEKESLKTLLTQWKIGNF